MPTIAQEVLRRRLERDGRLPALLADLRGLCGVRLSWRETAPEDDVFHAPLLIASVTVGYVCAEDNLSLHDQRALERVLRLAMEGLAHQLAHPAAARHDALPGAVSRAARYVREHFAEPLSLGQVAAEVGLGRERLSRLFHESLGVTFSDYLNRARLDHCRERLQGSSLTVAEIAFESGFQSLSQFNRRFKAAEGVSPREYRRRSGME